VDGFRSRYVETEEGEVIIWNATTGGGGILSIRALTEELQ
jgi:hypothetical protein